MKPLRQAKRSVGPCAHHVRPKTHSLPTRVNCAVRHSSPSNNNPNHLSFSAAATSASFTTPTRRQIVSLPANKHVLPLPTDSLSPHRRLTALQRSNFKLTDHHNNAVNTNNHINISQNLRRYTMQNRSQKPHVHSLSPNSYRASFPSRIPAHRFFSSWRKDLRNVNPQSPISSSPHISASPAWAQAGQNTSLKLSGDLQNLLNNHTLIITREIEWGQILIGFEQANKYSIKNETGTVVGFMAEESSLARGLGRQLMRTHRNFKITIFDNMGVPLLNCHRPPYLIKSNILVDTIEGQTLGEVQMDWHLYKRRYNLFVKQAEQFQQFAHINGGFLEWDFILQDQQGKDLGSVNKDWRGLAKELFTDANQYIIRFAPQGAPSLSSEQRCVMLGTALTIDFDYFSRSSGGLPIPWLIPTPIPPEAPGAPSIDPTGATVGDVAAGADGGLGSSPTWDQDFSEGSGSSSGSSSGDFGSSSGSSSGDFGFGSDAGFSKDDNLGMSSATEGFELGESGAEETGNLLKDVASTIWDIFKD